MMAHLHMTKDAVGTAQEKREVNNTPSEKKTTEHANTGKTKKYCKPKITLQPYISNTTYNIFKNNIFEGHLLNERAPNIGHSERNNSDVSSGGCLPSPHPPLPPPPPPPPPHAPHPAAAAAAAAAAMAHGLGHAFNESMKVVYYIKHCVSYPSEILLCCIHYVNKD